MKIGIKKMQEEAVLPEYQTEGAAGADISACIDESIVLRPGEQVIVPTGIALEIPVGYEVQIRARSGLAARHGIGLTNGIGTIDADYRGEIKVILINLGKQPFTVEPKMRIAQMVVARYEAVDFQLVTELSETVRGEKRFGSTG